MEFADLRPIEPITRDHDRKTFISGVKKLDNYLQDRAIGDTEKNLSRVFVLTLKEKPNTIVGYYSLASLQIPTENLPEQLSKKLNYKIVGTTLLGKLTVGEDWQREKCKLRLGEYLLLHAMLSTWTAAQSVASWALVVDVLAGERGDPTGFYVKKGFIAFQDNASRLFLPMATIEAVLRKAELI
ncbi:MAG: N-acetyltransferase [Candidatus Melainabacteria bacterium]|nr:N-acetyltransferase [Candidatus Melainabacteria bacterium]